ncbi:hypothetical protein CEXT_407331, partial [Caerostris extrusa]
AYRNNGLRKLRNSNKYQIDRYGNRLSFY